MGLPVRICQRFAITFVYADDLLSADAPSSLVRGVMNFSESLFDNDAQVGSGEVDILATGGGDEADVVAIFFGHANDHDKHSIDNFAGMLVG